MTTTDDLTRSSTVDSSTPTPSRTRRVTYRLLPFVPGLVFLLLWEYSSDRLVRAAYISSPTAVVERLYTLFASGEVYPHLRTTLTELGLGYTLGAIAGILIGYALGRSGLLARMFEPYILAAYGIPKIAFAPLFIIWFGVGISSKVALAAAMVFFMVFFNVYFGVRSVSKELVDVAEVMGVRGRRLTQYVYLPATLPFIMMGLRIGLPYAVIGVIVGEFTSASEGLGLYMYQASVTFDPAGVFAGVMILLTFVLLGQLLLNAVERRALRWQPRSTSHTPSA